MAVTDEPCLIGSGVLARRRVMEARLGEALVAEAIATLPAAARDAITHTTPISWVPVNVVEAFGDAVARRAVLEPEAFHDAVVRETIAHQLKTIWRVLLHFTGDDALVARTPVIYSKTRNVGRLSSKVVAPGRAELTLAGWVGVRERHVRAVGIGVESVLRLSGRRDVKFTYELTADGARYVATWRP